VDDRLTLEVRASGNRSKQRLWPKELLLEADVVGRLGGVCALAKEEMEAAHRGVRRTTCGWWSRWIGVRWARIRGAD
jgi:hypothetical protein